MRLRYDARPRPQHGGCSLKGITAAVVGESAIRLGTKQQQPPRTTSSIHDANTGPNPHLLHLAGAAAPALSALHVARAPDLQPDHAALDRHRIPAAADIHPQLARRRDNRAGVGARAYRLRLEPGRAGSQVSHLDPATAAQEGREGHGGAGPREAHRARRARSLHPAPDRGPNTCRRGRPVRRRRER